MYLLGTPATEIPDRSYGGIEYSIAISRGNGGSVRHKFDALRAARSRHGLRISGTRAKVPSAGRR